MVGIQDVPGHALEQTDREKQHVMVTRDDCTLSSIFATAFLVPLAALGYYNTNEEEHSNEVWLFIDSEFDASAAMAISPLP